MFWIHDNILRNGRDIHEFKVGDFERALSLVYCGASGYARAVIAAWKGALVVEACLNIVYESSQVAKMIDEDGPVFSDHASA